ncbi:MAG: CopL family metal-binding regulatory protein [Pseudomonadota bacterium]
MRHTLLHLLITFTLLLQGVGSAWAATRMAAGEVQVAAHVAELPPCHQEAAKAEQDKAGMNCCGTGSCHCVMSCGGVPALSLAASASLFAQQAETIAERSTPVLHAGHYGPPLRPPATLQS